MTLPFSGWWSYFPGGFSPKLAKPSFFRGEKGIPKAPRFRWGFNLGVVRFRSFRKLGPPDPTIKCKVTLVYHDKSGTGVGWVEICWGKSVWKEKCLKNPVKMSWGSRKQPVLRPQNGVSTERGQDSWGDVFSLLNLFAFGWFPNH